MYQLNEKLYDNINSLKVLEELESHKCIEEVYTNILKNVKETSAYIELKEIALLNFTQIMSGENDSQDNNEILVKKKTQTTQIGFLSDAIGSTITKLVSENLQFREADIRSVILETIQKLCAEFQSSLDKAKNNSEAVSSELSNSHKNGDSNAKSALPKLSRKSKRVISEETDITSDASAYSPSQRLSQRKRKPNLKYCSEDIISSTATFSSSDEDINYSHSENVNKKRKLFSTRI